jgi:hypothetical protein
MIKISGCWQIAWFFINQNNFVGLYLWEKKHWSKIAVTINQPNLSKKQSTGIWIYWNSGKNVKFSRFRYLFKSNTTQWKHQPWLTINVQTLFGCLLQISLILCPIVLLFKNCHECLGIYCWLVHSPRNFTFHRTITDILPSLGCIPLE